MTVTGPLALPPNLYRTIAAHAGLVEGLEPSDPIRLLRAAIGNETHESRLGNMPRRDASTESFEQLATRYTESLHVQLKPVVRQHLMLGREDQFTRDLGDTLTSGQVHSHAETDAKEREFGTDNSQNHGEDQRSLRHAHHAAQIERIIPSEIAHERAASASAFGSIFGGFGEMLGQDDQRGNPINSRTTFDRASGWDTDDGHLSNTATNGSAGEALTAADELERLRDAVRRTIDELERVRGSVQPPLPALPVNRGAFRIS